MFKVSFVLSAVPQFTIIAGKNLSLLSPFASFSSVLIDLIITFHFLPLYLFLFSSSLIILPPSNLPFTVVYISLSYHYFRAFLSKIPSPLFHLALIHFYSYYPISNPLYAFLLFPFLLQQCCGSGP
jgi:hypothetical protein